MSLRSSVRRLPVVGPRAAVGIETYRVWKRDPARRLARLLDRTEVLSVVQIGASDGDRQDAIKPLLLRHPGWTALLVEPFPPSFAQLRANYPADDRFRLVNVAVTETGGVLPFRYLREEARAELPGLPGHFDQLGSFSEGYLESELGAERVAAVAHHIATIDVPTLRLDELLEANGVTAIDLLVVDTNGHDWIVLSQFDVARFRPKVILFEHKHLSAEDLGAARAHVGDGYRITDLGDDTLCVRVRQ